jgi:hypothetical protein
MSAADHSPEEEQIFQHAAALPLAERITYLDSACESRPALRADVERLLTGLEDSDFMQRAVDRSATVQMDDDLARFKPEDVGDMVGCYKLLQRIGEAGSA